MEKYPYLNEAIAKVLVERRMALNMSKKKLSELAFIERAFIRSLESAEKNPTLNTIFYLSDALEMEPDEFVKLVKEEVKKGMTKARFKV